MLKIIISNATTYPLNFLNERRKSSLEGDSDSKQKKSEEEEEEREESGNEQKKLKVDRFGPGAIISTSCGN